MPNPRSTALIAGHPIHPMLIPFPIAFFVGTLACDLAFWRSGNPAWADATLWLLGAGLVMAALAAVIGVIDVFGDQQIRQLSTTWWHAGANVLLVLIELFNFFIRYSRDQLRSFQTVCCCRWSRFCFWYSADGRAAIWYSAAVSVWQTEKKRYCLSAETLNARRRAG